jgi:hypothetical protein
MNKVKIITCLYSDLFNSDLGGRASREHHYKLSLLSLLKMSNADFVCYTSDREIDQLKDFFYKQNNIDPEKINFVLYDLKQNKYTEILNQVKSSNDFKTSDRCYEIQYSKYAFFELEDGSYDYYFWFDAGLSHCGLIPEKHLRGEGYEKYFESPLFNNMFLNNLIKKSDDKFIFVAKENARNF